MGSGSDYLAGTLCVFVEYFLGYLWMAPEADTFLFSSGVCHSAQGIKKYLMNIVIINII